MLELVLVLVLHLYMSLAHPPVSKLEGFKKIMDRISNNTSKIVHHHTTKIYGTCACAASLFASSPNCDVALFSLFFLNLRFLSSQFFRRFEVFGWTSFFFKRALLNTSFGGVSFVENTDGLTEVLGHVMIISSICLQRMSIGCPLTWCIEESWQLYMPN